MKMLCFGRIGAVLAAVVLSGPIHAETAATAGEQNLREIEEIVVTARRVGENQQNVPMSVTALTPKMLEQQNIVRATDLMFAVPSLTFGGTFTPFLQFTAIRGLPTGIATYFAESPCCIGNASVPFLDIQSVQALAGPQGTLFGRSSAAGALLVEPVRPNPNATDGSVKVSLGDYGRQEYQATANWAVIPDKLAVRFAGSTMNIDGYTDTIGSDVKLDQKKNQQARIGIQFDSGRFTNYTVANYIDVDQSGINNVLTGINLGAALLPLPAAFAPYVFGGAFGGPCAGAVALGLNPDDASCVAERYATLVGISAALVAEMARIDQGGDSAKRTQPAPYNLQPEFAKLENWSILNSAEFGDIELGRVTVAIKDVLSYESIASNAGGNIDGIGGRLQLPGGFSGDAFQSTGGGGGGGNNTLHGELVVRMGKPTTIVSNDFKIDLDLDDGLLTSALGIYYSRREVPEANKGTINIYQIFSGILNPDLGYGSANDFNHDSNNTERAWYTQSTLDMSRLSEFAVPGLSLTAGYRKTWSKAYASGYTPVLDLEAGTWVPAPTLNEARTKSDDYNMLFTVAEQFTPDFMVYVSKTRAYVPGGVNTTSQQGSSLPGYSETYKPETVDAWEVGSKLDFVLGENIPVRLNAAFYKYDFKDIVVYVSAVVDGASTSYRTNAAAAEMNGFEVYGAIKPIEALEISFAYNYNDGKYANWTGLDSYGKALPGDPQCVAGSTDQFCLIDMSNNPINNMPEHQGHVTVVYSLPLQASRGDVTLSANVYAQSMVWGDSVGTAARALELLPTAKHALSRGSYTKLNLRADWANVVGSGFDAALFVHNATDELYGAGLMSQMVTLGYAAINYAPPRMWGLEVSKEF